MEAKLIEQKIYEIRGQKVMLDFDLANLYNVLTKRLNEQVKRNSERFPEDFVFALTEKEWQDMRSQFATAPVLLARRNLGKRPFAFTEYGVVMLASVLKSEVAVQMSIKVVRAFISLKKLKIQKDNIPAQIELLRKTLSERIDEHDIQLSAIYDAIENILDLKASEKLWEERERIGFTIPGNK